MSIKFMKIHINPRENPCPNARQRRADGRPRYPRAVTRPSPRASARAATPTPAAAPAPSRFVDGYLAYLLAQASHRISAEVHREVEAAGLSVTEWRVLASLAGDGRETIGALSELTLTKQPTLSKIVQRMERQGLVRRSATASDKRQTLVALTAQGQQAVQAHLQRALGHQARVLQPLGAREARQLITVLNRLVTLPPPR